MYVLGPRILDGCGGMLERLDPGPAARAVLRELHEDVGHTVHLAMLSGEDAVYVEKLVDPGLPYQTASRVGGRIPLHCTAIGKAILAAMAPDEASALVARGGLVRRTPRTIVTPRALRAELERRARARVRDRRRGERAQHPLRGERRARSPRPPRRGVSVSALTVELSFDGRAGARPAGRRRGVGRCRPALGATLLPAA